MPSKSLNFRREFSSQELSLLLVRYSNAMIAEKTMDSVDCTLFLLGSVTTIVPNSSVPKPPKFESFPININLYHVAQQR